MAHQLPDKSAMSGTFYISKATNKTKWRVMRESWKDGKRRQETVPRTAWAALGFSDTMTIDLARAHARLLNGKSRLERQKKASIVKIAKRVERDRLIHSVFIPEDLNQEFLTWLDQNVTGSPKHQEKLRIQWATAKRVVIACELLPEEYEANRKKIYRYLASQEYSLDYAKKLIRMLNLYGKFVARLTGRHFEEISQPKGHDREFINDSYLDSAGFVGASDPLTPELLLDLKEKVPEVKWKWMFISLWFGLRPSELDSCLNDKSHRVWRVEPGDPDVLWVYMPKLSSKPRELRWKPIPILFPEQKEALGYLFEGGAAKPLAKTLKRLTGMHVTSYACRKGFTDLMLSRKQRLEDIAQWLGHSSIEMTWTRYKNKRKVGFTR